MTDVVAGQPIAPGRLAGSFLDSPIEPPTPTRRLAQPVPIQPITDPTEMAAYRAKHQRPPTPTRPPTPIPPTRRPHPTHPPHPTRTPGPKQFRADASQADLAMDISATATPAYGYTMQADEADEANPPDQMNGPSADPSGRTPLRLRVDATPLPAAPGDVVTVTLTVDYHGEKTTDLQVGGVLPRGLDFVAAGDDIVWSPRLAALFWELEELAPGETATAQFQVQVTAVGPDVHVDLSLEADGSQLPDLVTASLRIPVLPSRSTQVILATGQAGELVVDGGRLRVRVPAGAIAAGLTLRHTWKRPASRQLHAFELTVTPPVRFQRPITVTLRLGQRDGEIVTPGAMTMRRFESRSGEWQLVETTMDAQAGTLSAELSEGGLLAVTEGDADDDQLKGILTPSVLGLQIARWTGDSNFSYPLELPAAAGGSAPTLALNYNSEEANGMLERHRDDHLVQASHLGIGWDLAGDGSISRDTEGRYYLNFAGGSFELVSIGGDRWKTLPESFLQIIHSENDQEFGQDYMYGSCDPGWYLGKVSLRAKNTNQWTVRTKDGMTYVFGSPADSSGIPTELGATAYYWSGHARCSNGSSCVSSGDGQNCGNANLTAYRWNLVLVQPPAGPSVNYQYLNTTQTIPDTGAVNDLCEIINERAGNEYARSFVRDTRLSRIEYGDGHYQVEFNYSGDRADVDLEFWQPSGWNCNTQYRFSDHRLTGIVVRARPDTQQGWNDSHVVRRYELTQDYSADPPPPSPQATHLRLRQVTQYDGLGSGSAHLPTYEFAYSQVGGRNGVVLSQVENGYGGKIILDYEDKGCGGELDCPWGAPQNGRIVVTTRHVSPWPGQEQSVQTYTYTGGLYVDEGSAGHPRWAFYGFKWVAEKLYTDGQGQLLRKEVTRFYQSDQQRKGKKIEEKVVAPDGSLLHRFQYWYSSSEGWPRLWKILEQADSTQQRTVRRLYHQTGRQGNGQYGNLTRLVEYDANDVIYRNTTREFHPNDSPDVYIVNKPGLVIDYEGSSLDFSAIRRQHNMQYDGQASYQDPPTQGLLTYEKIGRSYDIWEQTYYTWDTATGNLTATRRVRGSGDEVEEHTEYDDAFGAFPVRVIQAYGTPETLETEYVYYGVNDGAWPDPIAGRFGQLKQVIDRSNSDGGDTLVAEERSYDTFGRLCTVSYAHPDNANQTERAEIYRYNDVNTCEDQGSQEPALPPFDPTATNPPKPFAVVQRLQDGGGDSLGSGGGLKSYTFYDGLGRVWQTQQETDIADQWLTTHTGYDAQGLVAARYYPFPVTGSGNRGNFVWPMPAQYDDALTTTYDGLGRVLREVQYDGSFSEHVYQAPVQIDGVWYWPEQVTDPVGRQRVTHQDSWGRLARVVEVDGGNQYVTRYSYDVQDNLLRVEDAAGNVSVMEYDSLGRKLHMHDPDLTGNGLGARNGGCETLVENDGWGDDAWEAYGSQISSWGCKGAAWHWGQRALEVVAGTGSGWLRVKTYNTWQPGQTYAVSVWVRRASGSGGTVLLRVWTEVAGEQSVATSATLTTSWQKVEGSYTIPAGATDVRIMLRFPDNATVYVDDVNADYWWSYRYDGVGNLLQQVDGRGQEIDFSYDALNRLSQRSPVGGTVATYEYDTCQYGKGRLCRSYVGSQQYERSYAYDRRGQVTSEAVTIDGTSYTTGYAYDRLGRLTSMTYPDGEEVTYTYDGGGQLARLSTNQGADYVSDTVYDARGRLEKRLYGGVDLEDSYSYWDQSGNFRLRRHKTRRSSQPSTTYLKQEYLYDAAGDILRWQDHGFPGSWQRRFAYDALGRLCGASYDNQDTTEGCGRVCLHLRRCGQPDLQAGRDLELSSGWQPPSACGAERWHLQLRLRRQRQPGREDGRWRDLELHLERRQPADRRQLQPADRPAVQRLRRRRQAGVALEPDLAARATRRR